jgi:hypothetical protein
MANANNNNNDRRSAVYWETDLNGHQIGPVYVFRFDTQEDCREWGHQVATIKRDAAEIGQGSPDNIHLWQDWLGRVRTLRTRFGDGRVPVDIARAERVTTHELRNLGAAV